MTYDKHDEPISIIGKRQLPPVSLWTLYDNSTGESWHAFTSMNDVRKAIKVLKTWPCMKKRLELGMKFHCFEFEFNGNLMAGLWDSAQFNEPPLTVNCVTSYRAKLLREVPLSGNDKEK
jgi:hypothetical protein